MKPLNLTPEEKRARLAEQKRRWAEENRQARKMIQDRYYQKQKQRPEYVEKERERIFKRASKEFLKISSCSKYFV